MQRKFFDIVASGAGAVFVIALVVAGSLLMWGASFANSNVHNQLDQQQIYFPPAAAFAHPKAGTEITPSMIPTVSQYAGQQVLTGQQAEVYANDFIAQHLYNMPYHGVYAQISSAARAATPGSAQAAKLTALEQTSFQGTTLRGLLLEAYGFSVMGTIAFWGGVAAFALAAVMLVFVILGFVHARRTPETSQLVVHDTHDTTTAKSEAA
jgi:hypothetical protein